MDTSQLLAKDCNHLLLEELAPFLQEWLWFRLLGETIGIGSRVEQIRQSRSSFIAEREDGIKIITSSVTAKCILLAENQDDFHLTKYAFVP